MSPDDYCYLEGESQNSREKVKDKHRDKLYTRTTF